MFLNIVKETQKKSHSFAYQSVFCFYAVGPSGINFKLILYSAMSKDDNVADIFVKFNKRNTFKKTMKFTKQER